MQIGVELAAPAIDRAGRLDVVGEHEARVGVAQDVEPVVVALVRVDGHQHPARGEGGKGDHGPVDPVGRDQRDAIARLMPRMPSAARSTSTRLAKSR